MFIHASGSAVPGIVDPRLYNKVQKEFPMTSTSAKEIIPEWPACCTLTAVPITSLKSNRISRFPLAFSIFFLATMLSPSKI